MADRALPDHAPGEYRSHGRGSYYIPDELPPRKDIEFADDFSGVFQRANFELGRLAAIGAESDTSPLLYTTMVRREAVESVLVEGGDVEIEEMFTPGDVDRDNTTKKSVREALNYETAIREGAEAVEETGDITLGLLGDLHYTLLEGARGDAESIGEFRDGPIHIPPPTPAEEPFVAPPAHEVPRLVENLEEFIASGGGSDTLAEIGIAHYQIETIHPFGDGNGRLGRVLITLQLLQRGYLEQPYLYPSAYFNENKIEYVRRMRAVSENGEWGPWLEFFVDGIRQQAEAAFDRTRELRSLRQEYERRYGQGKTAADRLAIRLFQEPYIDTTSVVDLLDVSDQTARNAIAELEADGVLEETTGKQRYKEWKALDIFDILGQQSTV